MKKWLEGLNIKNLLYSVAFVIFAVLVLVLASRWSTGGQQMFGRLSYGDEVLPARVFVVLAENHSSTEISMETEVLFEAEITGGERKGQNIYVSQHLSTLYNVQYKKVENADKVMVRYTDYDGEGSRWVFVQYDRSQTILGLLIAFAALLLLFGGKKGLATIFSLGLTFFCIFYYFLPAVLAGRNIYLSTIFACAYVIIVALILLNGINYKTISAAAGCFGGLVAAGLIFRLLDHLLMLTGSVSEESEYLLMMDTPMDLKAIIFASILIGVSGGVLDVGVSISSSLSEIYTKGEKHSIRDIFLSGMNIGRDIIGTMTNTLILVYIGGSLSTTLLLISYSNSFLELINREAIIIEILQSVIGSIGLLFTIPITAVVYGLGVNMPKREGKPNKRNVRVTVADLPDPPELVVREKEEETAEN